MRRLLDDLQLPAAMRADLLRARAAGREYPTSAKLLQLQAALAGRPVLRPGSADALHERPRHAAAPGWMLAKAVLLVGGATFLALPGTQRLQPDRSAAAEIKPPRPDAPASASAELLPSDRAALCAPPMTATNAKCPAEAQYPLQLTAARAAPLGATVVTGDPESASVHTSAGSRATGDSARREITQLVRIRALLGRDPAAAWRLAQRGEREFPRGLLSEERQALAIVALAKTGAQDAASRNAQRYFARYPHTPMRHPIEAALQR